MEGKKQHKKLNIKFAGERKEMLYSTWQITKILDTIGDYNYKKNIIRELVEVQDIKNIIILDESAKVKLKYSKEDGNTFELNSDTLLELYHKGAPISLNIDRKYLIMYFTFKIFSKLYKEYNNNNEEKIDYATKKNLLFQIYEELLGNNIDFLKKIKKQYKIEISEYENEISNIDKLLFKEELFDNLDAEERNKEEYDDVRKMRNRFFYYFNTLNRPLIYVEFEDESYQLVGSNMINSKKFNHDNVDFLETKLIKQNSPLELILGVSIALLPQYTNLAIVLYNHKREDKEDLEEISFLEDKVEELKNGPYFKLDKKEENEFSEELKVIDMKTDMSTIETLNSFEIKIEDIKISE